MDCSFQGIWDTLRIEVQNFVVLLCSVLRDLLATAGLFQAYSAKGERMDDTLLLTGLFENKHLPL